MSEDEIRTRFEYRYVRELDLASISGQASDIDVVERADQPGSLFVRKTYRFRGIATSVSKAQQQLLSEYRILSSLRHPHIVPLVDCEYKPQQKRWQAYLYMEYCKYGDLSRFIPGRTDAAGQQLTESQFWDVSYQLGSALLYCHMGIVVRGEDITLQKAWGEPILHRDIKPHNGRVHYPHANILC